MTFLLLWFSGGFFCSLLFLAVPYRRFPSLIVVTVALHCFFKAFSNTFYRSFVFCSARFRFQLAFLFICAIVKWHFHAQLASNMEFPTPKRTKRRWFVVLVHKFLTRAQFRRRGVRWTFKFSRFSVINKQYIVLYRKNNFPKNCW